ncbi:MAG: uroporphyrinogen-III synthase [Leptothrix sp. (in: b-proteobacteria)]
MTSPAERPCLLVTRPQPQADEWVARLQALGQPARALPLLVIEPVAAFAPAVRQAWQALAGLDLVMFVSPNAVLQFMALRPAEAVWPAHTLAAATGPGTVAALLAQGVPRAQVVAPAADSAQFDAEALWHQQLAQRDWSAAQVLIVRGEDGRDWLADTLRAHGAQVQPLGAYRRVAPDASGETGRTLTEVSADPTGCVWLFSSSEAIGHLLGLMRAAPGAEAGGASAWQALLQVPVIATHPRIAQTAMAAGWSMVRHLAPDPDLLVAALAETHWHA